MDMPIQPLSRRLAAYADLLLLPLPEHLPAALVLQLQTGSHHEPPAFTGMAHFMEHLVFRGSRYFTGADCLIPWLQARGGQVNATTAAGHTGFHFEAGCDELLPAAERLVDMLAYPLFEPSSLASEREVLEQEYRMYAATARIHQDASAALFLETAHPQRLFRAGNRHSLQLESADFMPALQAHHQRVCLQAPLRLCLAAPASRLPELANGLCERLTPLLQTARQPQAVAPSLAMATGGRALLLVPGGDGGLLLHVPFYEALDGLEQLVVLLQQHLPSGQAGSGRWQCRLAYQRQTQAILTLYLPGARQADEYAQLARLAGWLRQWQAALEQPAMQQLLADTRLHGWQMAGALDRARDIITERAAGSCPQALLLSLQQFQQALHAGDFVRLYQQNEPLPIHERFGLPLAARLLPSDNMPVKPDAGDGAWQHPLAGRLPVASSRDMGAAHKKQAMRIQPAHWPTGQAVAFWAWQGPGAGYTELPPLARQVAQAWSEQGVQVALSARGSLTLLRLYGPQRCLPLALDHLLDTTLQPEPGNMAEPVPEPDAPSSLMPLRQLLARLPRVLAGDTQQAGPVLAACPAALLWLGAGDPEAWLQPHWQAVLGEPERPVLSACRQGVTGWQQVQGLETAETLLVAFYPLTQPGVFAVARAAAPVLQSALLDELRTRQALCYAVAVRVHDQDGQRGLVIAVQSSSLMAGALWQALQQALDACLPLLEQQQARLLDSCLQQRRQQQAGRLPAVELAGLYLEAWLRSGLVHTSTLQPLFDPVVTQKELSVLSVLLQKNSWLVLSNQSQGCG